MGAPPLVTFVMPLAIITLLGLAPVRQSTAAPCDPATGLLPLGIAGFQPSEARGDEIIQVTGEGFGYNPRNLSLVLWNGSNSIPFEVLTANGTELTARLGAVPPDAQPGLLQLDFGGGVEGFYEPFFQYIDGQQWQVSRRWRGNGASVVSSNLFTPLPSPPPTNSAAWYFSGAPTNTPSDNGLYVFLPTTWPANPKVKVSLRAFIPSRNTGLEVMIDDLRFPTRSPDEYARRICDAIQAVSRFNSDGLVAGCGVAFPSGRMRLGVGVPLDRLTAGHLNICIEPEPPGPVITGVNPRDGREGDLITITGNGFVIDPNQSPDLHDYSLAALNGALATPLQVLSMTSTQIQARVGPVDPSVAPGPVVLSLGRGQQGSFTPPSAGLVPGSRVWTWTRVSGSNHPSVSLTSAVPFSPQVSVPAPGVQQFFSGPPSNGVLGLTLRGDWPRPALVRVEARAHQVASRLGRGLLATDVRLAGGGVLECASRLCDVVRSAFCQQAGTDVNCTSAPSSVGDGSVTFGLSLPEGGIDSGHLTISVAPAPEALVTEEIRSLRDANGSGVLLNFTVPSNRNYDSNAILASASVLYQTAERTAIVHEYLLAFRLLDSRGNPVPISASAGGAFTASAVTTSLSLVDTVTLPLPGGEDSVIKNYELRILPAEQLRPWEHYSIELSLKKRLPNTGPFVDTGDLVLSAPKTYLHFPGFFTPDPAFNVLATLDNAAWTRTCLVQTVPGKNSFQASVDYTLQRFDNFLQAVKTDVVTVHFNYELRDAATDALVPLKASQSTLLALMDSFAPTANPNINQPFVLTGSRTINLEPTDGTQLDSVNNTYRLTVSIDHIDEPGQPSVAGNTLALAPHRLLHFNGHLFFGSIDTVFTSIDNTPPVNAVLPPDAVRTELGVNANSGSPVGQPNYTYGDGADLSVVLRPNGNAEYTGVPPVALNGPLLAGGIHCVEFERSNLSLDATGAKGDFKTKLPTGFGWRPDLNGRVIKSMLTFTGIAMNQSLLPLDDPTLATPLFACEETKPFWIQASAIQWRVNDGEFWLAPTGIEYVRRKELNDLEAAPGLAEPDMGFKRSNEQYFRFLNAVLSPRMVIKAHTNCTARMTLDVSFSPGQFITHFPYDSTVSWTGASAMSVQDDLIIPASSSLEQVAPVVVKFSRDCSEPDCPDIGAAGLTLAPDSARLRFTVDGGLHAQGTLPLPLPLKWGWIDTVNRFAHETDPWSAGHLLVAGCFLRGDQLNDQVPQNVTPLQPADGPGVILLTGVVPGDLQTLERPESIAYEAEDVSGDYAGLNFLVGPAAMQGESTLAALPTGKYPLRSRCKYYARFWGISGIHEAQPNSFPPEVAKLYGYDVTIDNFGLSFLGSRNIESRTLGGIFLPWPSQFTQDFTELRFHCNGALKEAKVPASDPTKTMAYWKGDFNSQAIHFEHDPNKECDPSEGFLVIGVQSFASHVAEPLYGELGFTTNGTIINPTFAIANDLAVRSRLKPPNNFTLNGPAAEKYNVVPIFESYYNNFDDHDTDPGVTEGWLNFGVLLDVAFFEDVQTHLHITGGKQDSSIGNVHVMGGWPNDGWKDGNNAHYFSANSASFDEDNTGFPKQAGVKPGEYRRVDSKPGLAPEQYLARARKNWLNVVDFDYPMRWDYLARSFRSLERDNNVAVLHMFHEAKYLSAERAELAFHAQLDPLPSINLANIFFSELTGTANVLGNALGGVIAGEIKSGLGKLDGILDDQLNGFLQKPFDDLFGPVDAAAPGSPVEQLYQVLQAAYVNKQWQPNQPADAINAAATSFLDQLENNLMGGAGGQGLLDELYDGLDAVSSAIQKVQDVLEEDGAGNRILVKSLVDELLGEFAGSLANMIGGSEIEAALKEADPTFDELSAALAKLKDAVEDARDAAQNGALQQQLISLKDQFKTASQFDSVVNGIKTDVEGMLDLIQPGLDNFSTTLPKADFKLKVRQSLEDHFHASPVVAPMQTVFKQHLYDLDSSIRQGLDSVMQQVNNVVRDLMAVAVAGADNSFTQGLGLTGESFAAAKLNGYGHIKGDSLNLVRVDLLAQLQLAGALEFSAFLEIKELDSEGSPDDCGPPPGEKWTEVTLGADEIKLEWLGDLTAGVETKFTFDDAGDVINLMGALAMKGKLQFEGFALKELALGFAAGDEMSFGFAKARVEVNSKELAAGFFAGKTCVLTPLQMVNNDFAGAIGSALPFTGIYVYAEAWYPINELIGIPSSCFLNIRGGVGWGMFFNASGPVYGGQIHYGLSGEVLCLVEVQGEIDMVGVKNGAQYTIKGTGTVSGEIGECPFCVEFSRSIGLTCRVHLDPLNASDASVDWDVDF
jgi:hypothetical protein